MSKRKRSRRTKRNGTAQSQRSDEAAWTDIEQAFFAAAPPDEPEPPGEPARFDDLISAAPPRREMPAALARAVALLAWRSRRRAVSLALASVMLLIGLGAAVVASRKLSHPNSPIAPMRPAASAGAWPRPVPPMRT